MKNKRREFLKLSGLAGVAISGGGMLKGFASAFHDPELSSINFSNPNSSPMSDSKRLNEKGLSIIGLYGEWASGINDDKLPRYSFRRNEWPKLEPWRKAARQRLVDRLGDS